MAEKEVKSAEDAETTMKRKAEMEEIEVDVAAPEPPSKRARRALKKGKPLPAKPSSDDEKGKGHGGDEEGESQEKKEKTRAEHGIWVGNLPFTVTAIELRQWLVDNSGGAITEESITRVKLPTSKEAGREKTQNKGFAYVDFADIGSKVAAIALSETQLNYRRLLIKDSKSYEGRPAKEKEPEAAAADADGAGADAKMDANASRKIFVGNMSFKTTEEDVLRNFEKCGEIEWAKVATFEDTGKCKGYGWVKFKEPEAAAWAVKGFVKIKEEVETEADFEDDAEDEAREKQFKTRKWWVNRMLGRELKLELAEDDQARYKKRFRNGGAQRAQTGEPGADRPPRRRDDRSERPAPERKPATAEDIQAARLMGNTVQHTGSKVTFD